MKARGRYFGKLSLLSLIVSGSTLLVFGQTASNQSKLIAENPRAVSGQRSEADERFELDIAERRFTKEDFEASTTVGTEGDPRGVKVRIGVSLTADRIEVLLRNVHGSVRFRGALDRILEVLGKRPTSPPEIR